MAAHPPPPPSPQNQYPQNQQLRAKRMEERPQRGGRAFIQRQQRGSQQRLGRGTVVRGSGRGAMFADRGRGSGHGISGYVATDAGRNQGRSGIDSAAEAGRSHGGTHQQRYVTVAHRLEHTQHTQSAPDGMHQQEDVIVKAKKPRPPHCFRCKCNGHLAENCIADLDCYVCNKKNSHLASKCPLLKMPKPTATMFGCAKNELCFYRIPDFDYKLETPAPVPTALVKVTGGKLEADIIQNEPARLTRVEGKWEALHHGDDSFLATFPSEEELKRMTEVGFKLKSHGVTLTFSEWQSNGDVDPAYQLDEIWVHVTGVPHTWRHYLGFWALGSLIDATLDVDMLTYRKKGVVRILVGMLDKEQLPLTTDVVFNKVGYDLTFVVEEESFEPAVPVPSNSTPKESEDDGAGFDGAAKEGEQDHLNKKSKVTENASSSKAPHSGSMSAPMQVDSNTCCKDPELTAKLDTSVAVTSYPASMPRDLLGMAKNKKAATVLKPKIIQDQNSLEEISKVQHADMNVVVPELTNKDDVVYTSEGLKDNNLVIRTSSVQQVAKNAVATEGTKLIASSSCNLVICNQPGPEVALLDPKSPKSQVFNTQCGAAASSLFCSSKTLGKKTRCRNQQCCLYFAWH